MNELIKIIREEINNIIESYEDIGIDYVKNNAKKLNDYKNYNDKIVIDNITYLNFIGNDDWYIWNEIKAFDNNDGTEVGHVSYGKQKENDLLKASVDVRPDKRRMGIATNIYKWIEKLTGDKLYPDVPHTQSAAKFWGNPNRTFGYDK